jgi:hypothetical protein
MKLERKSLRLNWLVMAASLIVATPVRADVVTFTVGEADAGGYFPYDLSVLDQQCCLNIVGIIVTHGFTVFDLDMTSPIGQPAGWNYIPPIPGSLDSLTWYDFDPNAAIVPSDTPTSGFTFESQTAATSLKPGQFDIKLIYSDSSVKDYGDPVPEPSFIILLCMSIVFLIGRKYLHAGRGTR